MTNLRSAADARGHAGNRIATIWATLIAASSDRESKMNRQFAALLRMTVLGVVLCRHSRWWNRSDDLTPDIRIMPNDALYGNETMTVLLECSFSRQEAIDDALYHPASAGCRVAVWYDPDTTHIDRGVMINWRFVDEEMDGEDTRGLVWDIGHRIWWR